MMKALRSVLLLLALLAVGEPAAASPFGLKFLHKGVTIPPVTGAPEDTRFGTGNVTLNGTAGWLTFTPSVGVPITWVNNSAGDDTNNCTSYTTPCKTFDAAFAKFRYNSFAPGAHLRVAGKTGIAYVNHAVSDMGSLGGISNTYPTVIESYDPTDPTNAAKYGKLVGSDMPKILLDEAPVFGNSFSNPTNDAPNGSYYAFQGLDFEGQDLTGNGIAWQGGRHDGLVWQNCRFNAVGLTIAGVGGYDATGVAYNQKGNISKSSFFGTYVYAQTNTSGIYLHAEKDFWIQNSSLIHSGWRIGSSRDDVIAGHGGATVFNHGNYVSASEDGIRLDNVFYIDTAADGFNLRSNGDATDITSLYEPLAGNVGGFTSCHCEAPTGITAHVNRWLIGGGADINSLNPRSQGPWTINTIGDSYISNVAEFDNFRYPLGGGALMVSYNQGVNTGTATHSGNVATVLSVDGNGNPSAHGFTNGSHISVDHMSVTAFNASDVVVTVVDSTHFSYTMASTPGSDPTTSGGISGIATDMPQQYMALSNWRAYKYGNTLNGSADQFNITTAVHNTWTNSILDTAISGADMINGGGNSVSSSGAFPSYKTVDQVTNAVLTAIGLTPAATALGRKSQLVNAAAFRGDLPWSTWYIGQGFPGMGLTSVGTPSYQTYTDSPPAIYATSLANLTADHLNVARGTGNVILLQSVGPNPTLSAPSGLPSGFAMDFQQINNLAGSISAGSNSLTFTTSMTGITAGMYIDDGCIPRGLPLGTIITSVSGSTVTLSKASAATETCSNFSIGAGGRAIRYDGSGSGATAPSFTIRETSDDGATQHDTIFTVNITTAGNTSTLTSPTSSIVTDTTATVGVDADTTGGTVYAVVTTNSATPSAAQIEAGHDSTGGAGAWAGSLTPSAVGTQSFSATGLTAGTKYYVFFAHHIGTGDSNVVGSLPFTTYVLGSEIVTNGNFSSGTGWNLSASCSIGSGILTCTNATSWATWQSPGAGTVTKAHRYLIQFDILTHTSGTAYPYLGSTGTGLNPAGNVPMHWYGVVAADSSNELGFFFASNFSGTIDNYSVKEVLNFMPLFMAGPGWRRRRKRKAANDDGSEERLAA